MSNIKNNNSVPQSNINESAMGEIDIIAQQSNTFKEFVKEFHKEFSLIELDRETIKWLESIWKGNNRNESVNEDEKSPEEIVQGLKQMAMGDLERIGDYADMILQRMQEGQELSSWMYSQITLAVDQLNSVHDSMDGKDGVKEESINEEQYKVMGRPVTLNKGKKSTGVDWTVTFQNGKSLPLADVLSLIKPFPKGITAKESVNEVGSGDWHFKEIKKLWDKAGSFTRKKIAGLITKNPNSTWDKIEKVLKGSDYDDATYYTDMLHLESINELMLPRDVDSKMKELGISKIPISSQGEKVLKGMVKEKFLDNVTNKERLIYFVESLGKEKFGYGSKGKLLSPLVDRFWNDITSDGIYFGGKMAAYQVAMNMKDMKANGEEIDSSYEMMKEYFKNFGMDHNRSRVFDSALRNLGEWMKRNKIEESVNEAPTPKIKNTITKKEWSKIAKYNKHIGMDGTHYVMKYDDKIGTYLQAVKLVDEIKEGGCGCGCGCGGAKLESKDGLERVAQALPQTEEEPITEGFSDTIIQQLGGNRFIAMTGAKNFVKNDSKREVVFQLPKAKNGIKYVRITLTPMDVYNVDFISARGTDIKVVSKEKGVYADKLPQIFTKHTGLHTRL